MTPRELPAAAVARAGDALAHAFHESRTPWADSYGLARVVLGSLVEAGYQIVEPDDQGLEGLVAEALGERDQARAHADALAEALQMARGFLGMAIRSPRSAAHIADQALGAWKAAR